MFEGNNPLMRQEIVMPENTTQGLISLNVPAVVKQIPGIKNSYINLPNFGSHQQFPQEMEFTENVSTIPMKRLVFKEGGILKAQNGMGGRPSGNNSFNAALFSRDALGVANYLRADRESENLYTIDKNIADITGRRTIKAPNILTNRRFMTNTNNQYNDWIGKYNTSIGQQITNDAFANMTARLIGADKTSDIMRDMNRELSAEFNNAQDK